MKEGEGGMVEEEGVQESSGRIGEFGIFCVWLISCFHANYRFEVSRAVAVP